MEISNVYESVGLVHRSVCVGWHLIPVCFFNSSNKIVLQA